MDSMTETPDHETDPRTAEERFASPQAPGPQIPGPQSGEGPAGEPGYSTGRLWREWIRPLLIVLAVMGSFRSALADWNDVPTGSMKPTIVEGDRIFVNKLAYDLKVPFTLVRLMEWGNPRPGDIVVLFSPDDGKRLVKRVVGVPGDEIRVERGQLFINGKPVPYERLPREAVHSLAPAEARDYRFAEEDLGDGGHTVMVAPWAGNRNNFGPVKVPENHYFMMGDNRSHSRDSRTFGFVERKRIVGQATAVVLSLNREEHYRPRWDRFFQSLE